LHQQQHSYDTLTWPHATKGFFKLKKKIPIILSDLALEDA
jgi:deoxyribodipyrimidine photo-lyase